MVGANIFGFALRQFIYGEYPSLKRFIVYLLLIICCLALPGSGFAAEKIRVGYSNNPPLSIHDSEGVPQGLSVDIFNAIAHKQGWDIVWELGPTHTLLRQFKE